MPLRAALVVFPATREHGISTPWYHNPCEEGAGDSVSGRSINASFGTRYVINYLIV